MFIIKCKVAWWNTVVQRGKWILPIVLSYEAITTASCEGCKVNVCTSSTASNDSFVKSTGTSVGGLTWLGRNPTRDDPRCKRALDLPVWIKKIYTTLTLLGIHGILKPKVIVDWRVSILRYVVAPISLNIVNTSQSEFLDMTNSLRYRKTPDMTTPNLP